MCTILEASNFLLKGNASNDIPIRKRMREKNDIPISWISKVDKQLGRDGVLSSSFCFTTCTYYLICIEVSMSRNKLD